MEGVSGDHDTHQANSAEYNGMNLDDNINFGFQRNHVEEDHGPIDYTIDLEGYLPVAQTENVEEPPDSEPTRKSRKRRTCVMTRYCRHSGPVVMMATQWH